MKAAVLRSPRPIEDAPLAIEDLPDPEPGPEEVLVKVLACGICHTDLHIAEGELPPKQAFVVPGHQIVGRVAKTGQSAHRFRKGDLVGATWLYSACLDCEFCRHDNENLCYSARFTGYDVNGGYAQYAVIPQDFAQAIPMGFQPLQAAPLLCAGVIGYRSLKLAQVAPGSRLGLFGFGASAHIVIQVAAYWECQTYVFSRSEKHRHLARELGAVWTGDAGKEPPGKLHSAIIFAPAGELVPRALELLEKGGTLALAGIYMTPIPSLDYTRHLYHEKRVQSVANCTRKDAADLLKLAAEVPIRTEVQIFPVGEANRALLFLKQGKIQGAGVLEIPD